MRHISIAAILGLAFATAAPAQETGQQPAQGEPAAPSAQLPTGEPVTPDGKPVGQTYVAEEHGDWDLRCVRAENGNDPCQLYQLLVDQNGNSVAEFAVFPLPAAQGQAVAGGNIVTPLETLLTEKVTLAVDGANARRYDFTFCAPVGCVARIGLTDGDIQAFKAGKVAQVSIVPAAAPGQRITLEVSLTGFTAGYAALTGRIAK